jgi:uncharacterized pyridoxamine 5'-phosphate oxidase family protein
MDFKDCVAFANEHPVCYVATIDGDQARVRGFMMCFADETGFYFATLSPKAVTEQLKSNPKIEVCYYNNPAELAGAKQMRVTGEAEFVNDASLHKRVCQERAFLGDIIGEPIDPYIEIFRIHTGEAHFWTMMDVMTERELERIKF